MIRRRRTPRRLVFGRVGVAHKGRVVPSDKCPVERRADARIRLGADDDEAPDPEPRQDGLERGVLERVAVVLLDERLGVARVSSGTIRQPSLPRTICSSEC